MPGPAGSVEEQVVLTLDPQSITLLTNAVTVAFEKAFTSASFSIRPIVGQMAANTAKGILKIEPAAQRVGTAMKEIGTSSRGSFTQMERITENFVQELTKAGRAVGVIISELQRVSQLERRSSIDANQAASDSARLQIAELHNVGIQTNIEGQKAVVVARGVAKSRVLITQGAVRSIILLEKGLGATISGIARTSVKAIGSIFSGLGAIVRKGNSGVDAEMRRTTAAVERGLRATNNEFNSGLRGSLSRRESSLRSSFRTQEAIITKSAIRQQETLAGLRRGTQTGVLGAANRGLNIGAILGGAAVFQAGRSTFNVGSQFVQGLAVLQAQLGLTDLQMKAVDKLSIQLGNDITLPGVSALDAAQAIQTLTKTFGSLGPSAVDAAQQAAKGTLQLARATGASAEDSAAIIGSAVNVFGIAASDAVQVADNFAGALAKAAGVGFEEFKDSFVQGATVFNQFVGPTESANEALLDFNTTLAVLAKNGITGSNAGAGLKQFFLQGTKLAPKAQEASQQLAAAVGESGSIFFDSAGKARKYDDALRILRGGLVGMTDEQRNATLATLFGSRSITIANALVKESQTDYDNLRDSISQQGLAAKIAAAQNTGFKGALDALRSVVETMQIQLFKKLNPALGAVTLGFAELFNNVLSGTGAFAVLRRGLLGVAVGMGAIIAAKGAVEVIKLLGTAMKLALTPFGAVLVAAGLLGAAISILADRSQPFRDAIGDLVDRLKGLGSIVQGAALKGLRALGGVIERDVLPFLQRLVAFLSEHVVEAFDATVRFITDKVIPALRTAGLFIGRLASVGFRAVVDFVSDHVLPALQEFARFVVATVVPIAVRVGTILAGAFDTALDAVQRFWHWVEPVLKPMLDGFKELASAIASIFTGGDLSSLGSGFAAVGSGIATSFTGIGKNLLGVLDRLWETLKAWFKEHFTGAKLIDLGKGFLDLVEFIGHTLGAIVTSPTFVRAVAVTAAGLAAAAVLIVGRFIEGFGKALIDNLPGLAHLITQALIDLFKLVLSNPLLTAVVVVGLLGIFKAKALIQAATAAGSSAGGGFLKGLAGSLKASAIGGKGLVQGLFGGTGTVFPANAAREFKTFNAEVLGTQKVLRALGSTTIIKQGHFKSVEREVATLKESVSEAQLKGLLLRDTFKQVSSGVSTAFKGLRQAVTGSIKGVVKGVGDALAATNVYTGPGTSGAKAFTSAFKTSIAGSGKNIAAGFAAIGVALKETAAAQGKSVGGVLGSALAKAAIGAVSVVAGFQAGKAEGAAGGSGLISALLGGVTAGALIGGPFGAAVGIVTAGAGLIGAAFGRSEAKAKAFRAEVNRLADSFKTTLTQAFKEGQITADNLDFTHIISLEGNKQELIDSINKALQDKGGLQQFVDAGLVIPVDVIPLINASGGDQDKFAREFQKLLFTKVASEPEFQKLFGSGLRAADVQNVLTLALANGTDAQKDFAKSVLAVQTAILDTNSAAIKAVTIDRNLAIAAGEIKPIEIFGGNTHHDFETLDELTTKTKGFGDQIASIARVGALRTLTSHALDAFNAFIRLGSSAEEANHKLANLGLPTIPQPIIDQWTDDVEGIGKEIDKLQGRLDAAPGKIAERISAALNITPSTAVVDQAIVDSAGIADAIQSAVTEGGIAGAANLRLQISQATIDIGKVLTQGIIDGVVKTPADAEALLAPLKQAMIDSLDPNDPGFQAASDNITLLFAVAVQNLQPTIDEVHATKVAEDFNKKVQQFLTDNPLTTTVDAELLVKLNTDQGFLTEGDARKFGIPQDTKTKILNQIIPTTTDAAAKAKPVGSAITRGIGDGMLEKAALNFALGHATTVAQKVTTRIKDTLGIQSPSRVMMEVGGFITTGLAQGIIDGSDAAATAAANAVQAAVDAARGVADNNPVSLRMESHPLHVGRDIIENTQMGVGETRGVGVAAQRGAQLGIFPKLLGEWVANAAKAAAQPRKVRDLFPDFPTKMGLLMEDPVAKRGRDVARAARQGLPQTQMDTGAAVAAIAHAAAVFAALEEKVPAAFRADSGVAKQGRGVIRGSRAGLNGAEATGLDVIQRAQLGTKVHPGDDTNLGALKAPLKDLITLAQSLVKTAEALSKRGPDETNVTIVEAKDARSTARATIAELRADRLLMKGVR